MHCSLLLQMRVQARENLWVVQRVLKRRRMCVPVSRVACLHGMQPLTVGGRSNRDEFLVRWAPSVQGKRSADSWEPRSSFPEDSQLLRRWPLASTSAAPATKKKKKSTARVSDSVSVNPWCHVHSVSANACITSVATVKDSLSFVGDESSQGDPQPLATCGSWLDRPRLPIHVKM